MLAWPCGSGLENAVYEGPGQGGRWACAAAHFTAIREPSFAHRVAQCGVAGGRVFTWAPPRALSSCPRRFLGSVDGDWNVEVERNCLCLEFAERVFFAGPLDQVVPGLF